MKEKTASHPLEDFVVTLEYTVKEINGLLNLIGKLPFGEAYMAINSIQMQVGPQVEKAHASLEAALKATKEKSDESKTAS